ncbi:chloride channel protein [Rhizobium sp. FY34]|uniref:chloride channel protein n=1 Tax=Rhizobium sp. FY34 TaxID=2562309 RepID=UPI0010BFC941|nr:chloride channel protein [Rhizobium sp. FY34]
MRLIPSFFSHALLKPIQARGKLIRKKAFARGSEIGLIVSGATIGVAAGTAVSVMSWISRAMHSLIFGIDMSEWLSSAEIDNRLIVLIAPIIGGMLLGLFLYILSRKRRRPIIDPIEANALYGGRISLTDSFIVAAQNLISNGFGASVGLEAGYTQLSTGIASKLGTKLKLRREDMRILVGCGAAGAIASAFNAPLTGAFYAFELIIGTYSMVALAPVVVSAIIATFVARGLSGDSFLIEVGEIGTIMPADYVPAILLGAICAGIGILIMQGVAFVEEMARKSSLPPHVRPALGGIVIGLLALVTPQVLSAGHGALHLNLDSDAPVQILIGLFLLKSFASAISIGSGFRGGLFFASLFMGALVGKIFAMPADLITTGSLTPTVLAVVGMSALAVAIIGGPLTMTFLALEITADFPITALVLAAVITSSVVVRTTFGYSFATWRFHLRGESIRSAHDVGWIRNLTVDKLMRADVKCAKLDVTLEAFRETFPLGSAKRVVITDDSGRYTGIISLPDIYADEAEAIKPRTQLADFIRHQNDFLLPQMNAKQAAGIFEETHAEALAVISNLIDRRVMGQLSEAHTLRRYSEELDRQRREAVGEVT